MKRFHAPPGSDMLIDGTIKETLMTLYDCCPSRSQTAHFDLNRKKKEMMVDHKALILFDERDV